MLTGIKTFVTPTKLVSPNGYFCSPGEEGVADKKSLMVAQLLSPLLILRPGSRELLPDGGDVGTEEGGAFNVEPSEVGSGTISCC